MKTGKATNTDRLTDVQHLKQ